MHVATKKDEDHDCVVCFSLAETESLDDEVDSILELCLHNCFLVDIRIHTRTHIHTHTQT
jgi:hypothetical protein